MTTLRAVEPAQAQLEQIASEAVRMACSTGATDAECTLIQGDEFSVSVRRGEVENLKQAGSRGAGIRVLVGKRSASAYTSDLTPEGIRAMVSGALQIAEITSDDAFSGLPEDSEFGRLETDLQLYFDDVEQLSTEEKIRRARDAEAAALAVDERITNSEGASFDSYTGYRVFANSRGFVNSYRSSNCSLATVPVAKQGNSMERDYWMTASRSAARLESSELVGQTAARRVLRRLGRPEGVHSEGAGHFRGAGGAKPARSCVRCGERRRGLSQGVLSGRKAGRESGIRTGDDCRRRYNPGALRQLAVRR